MADLLSRVSHMMALPPSLSGRMPPSAAVAFVLRPDLNEDLIALRLVVKHSQTHWVGMAARPRTRTYSGLNSVYLPSDYQEP